MSNQLHDLAAAFALDALDDLDRARFVRHLDQCDECRASIAGFTDSMTALAGLTSEAPPPGLKQRLLESVAVTPQVPGLVPRRTIPWYAATVAAALAMLALIGWSLLNPSRLINAVLADPAAVTILAAPTDSGEGVFDQARLVYSENLESAVLVFEGLDQPGTGQTYEIWLIDDTEPVPAGLFHPDDSGSAAVRVEGEITPGLIVAVTRELDGGAASPTGEPLLTAEIGA